MDQALFDRFEAGAIRRGSNCEKWDDNLAVFGREDVLPLWVADMDFQAPEPVVRALVERAENGVFGYAKHDGEGDRALIDWMQRRHALTIEPECIRTSPGVVSSMIYALRTVANPGDKVAIMTPVYGPFFRMTRRAGMELVECPLQLTDGGYKMDLALLEAQMNEGVKVVMLCSPHNPVGRVWTMEELTELCALCTRYGVRIISDEIHMDFVMPGHVHTPILAVPGGEGAVMLVSATKSFNLAGLRHSTILVKDPDVRAKLDSVMTDCGVGESNLFGELAQKVAYQSGAPWLDALLEYLDGSQRWVTAFLEEKLPMVVPARLEGTYLMWLDFRALGLSSDKLKRFLVDDAGVGLNIGTDFGEVGAGYARLNLATPRKNVRAALEQIERAVRAR